MIQKVAEKLAESLQVHGIQIKIVETTGQYLVQLKIKKNGFILILDDGRFWISEREKKPKMTFWKWLFNLSPMNRISHLGL